jgi:hypothetical protein
LLVMSVDDPAARIVMMGMAVPLAAPVLEPGAARIACNVPVEVEVDVPVAVSTPLIDRIFVMRPVGPPMPAEPEPADVPAVVSIIHGANEMAALLVPDPLDVSATVGCRAMDPPPEDPPDAISGL